MFTADNTQGFTAEQIAVLNEVLAELTAAGVDESNASDILNNAWGDEIVTADDLRSQPSVAKWLN